MENLDSSSAPIMGAVFTYQNMYSSRVKNLKDIPSIEAKMKDLEKNFEENFERSSVLHEGKLLLAQRTLNVLRTKIEMVYFSILKRTSAISKLAGNYYIT